MFSPVIRFGLSIGSLSRGAWIAGALAVLLALGMGLAPVGARAKINGPQSGLPEETLTIVTAIGERHSFTVEMATTEKQQEIGLMFRNQLDPGHGMLFPFAKPKQASFWMRNTLIPLDMIFADARGVVQRVHINATPLDETPIPGGPGIQYVLEINGGLAALLGIDAGSQLQHPAIDPGLAAWSCDPS